MKSVTGIVFLKYINVLFLFVLPFSAIQPEASSALGKLRTVTRMKRERKIQCLAFEFENRTFDLH